MKGNLLHPMLMEQRRLGYDTIDLLILPNVPPLADAIAAKSLHNGYEYNTLLHD
jgi:hypothetical protein